MSIEELVQNYGTYIYNYAMKLACHPQKAEDIAQETMIKAWRNLDKLREEYAVKKWLRTICLNEFLMTERKEKQENTLSVAEVEELDKLGQHLAMSVTEPEEEVVVSESIRELQNGCFYAMVRKLTLNQRIAFSLVDMFGADISDVADILQLSENATKGLLHRARMNIDAFFADHCDLIKAKNPCSCQAWIDFRAQHEQNKKAVQEQYEQNSKAAHDTENKHKIDSSAHFPKEPMDYKYDQTVRDKIYYLYQNMEQRRPSEEWFQQTIHLLQSKSIPN